VVCLDCSKLLYKRTSEGFLNFCDASNLDDYKTAASNKMYLKNLCVALTGYWRPYGNCPMSTEGLLRNTERVTKILREMIK
jgi:hypothetical protein